MAKDVKPEFELAEAGAALGFAHSKGTFGLCYVGAASIAQDAARGFDLTKKSEAAGCRCGQLALKGCENGTCSALDSFEAVRLDRLL